MKAKLKLNSKFIPVNTPKIFKEDKKNVNISLRDNYVVLAAMDLLNKKKVQEFRTVRFITDKYG